jgi:hypothetical protein
MMQKANMENIQIKAQRAETLQQLETEKKTKIPLFCTRVVLTAITALLNYYKNKNKESLQATYTTETRIAKAA